MRKSTSHPSARTQQQLRQHYLVEKELAARLKNATKQERRALYASVYDELLSRVPQHPSIARQDSAESMAQRTTAQMRYLRGFLKPSHNYLEIGPGDCQLALRVAQCVNSVVAVDVSAEIVRRCQPPGNFRLVISDGVSVDVPAGSVNVAFSNQVMEHLHPDDALEQLTNIYQALAPRGVYICVTPHAYMGPADISRHFDTVATGMHLKEYTYGELGRIFRAAGFRRLRSLVSLKWFMLTFPIWPAVAGEQGMRVLPAAFRRCLASHVPLRPLLQLALLGEK